jgi:predicted HTH transcriptional regulator
VPPGEEDAKELLLRRGLLWLSPEDKQAYCSPAGVLLFAKDPTKVYPHSCLRLLAFSGTVRDPKPNDFQDVAAPIPKALELSMRFIDKNTRHPLRVDGLRRVRLDEYPLEALREAVINALAHRDYEDASRKIHVELFTDRVEVISPGLLPGGLTLAQLRSGNIQPCSRNPVLAQGLRALGLMEELGTGVVRMRRSMLDHGLGAPEYSFRDGCFVVTLHGPGGDLDRLKTAQGRALFDVPESIERELNERQKDIMAHLAETGFVTTGWCRTTFGVALLTAQRDLARLKGYGLIESTGRGRSARYVPKVTP